MNRVFGRFATAITEPWQMYPVGVLFGLGFDTATEVALLFLAAGAAGAGLPFYAVLCLPILFAAGMCLMDTIDSVFMNVAYGWAFAEPARKVFYNVVITGLSVAVALVIATIQVGGLLATELNAHGQLWSWLAHISINTLGLIIAGMFLATWAIAVVVWRLGRIGERWGAQLHKEGAAEPR
jgi:high-affinity nickel-transport protein